MMQMNSAPPKLKDISPNGGFSEQLEQIIARALQKSPADRFQTMEELELSLMQLRSREQQGPSALKSVQPGRKTDSARSKKVVYVVTSEILVLTI